MNHSSNESLSKLEFKNDFISDFAKNKLVEVVRVTNALLEGVKIQFLITNRSHGDSSIFKFGHVTIWILCF